VGPSLSVYVRLTVLLFAIIVIPHEVLAAKHYLTITSDPSGATVEINGVRVGTTPYQVEIPDGYLHGTKTVFGKVLRQPQRMKVTCDGYLPREVELTGPSLQWIAMNGTNHGSYWLLKSDSFSVRLEKASTIFTGSVQAAFVEQVGSGMRSSMSPEEIVRQSNSAVLFLQGSGGTGSGFLISETGVAVTNAHVARGESDLIATTGNGQNFKSRVVYIDPTLDIALVKLEGEGFPHLTLGDISSAHPGGTAIVIGTPSKGFQNSVTRGVIGGVGPLHGNPGIWIQTDAAINPGNSGGPLLSDRGEVIGITTQKQFSSTDGRPLQGIGFALSSADLAEVLRRFYPNLGPNNPNSPVIQSPGKGRVSILAQNDGADVYVDGKFVGNAPSVVTLSSGTHKVEVKDTRHHVWQRDLEVMPDSELKLNAVFPDDGPSH
jgi:S1-C subfamily serine protease